MSAARPPLANAERLRPVLRLGLVDVEESDAGVTAAEGRGSKGR